MLFNRFSSCVVNEILLCTMNAQKKAREKSIGSSISVPYIGLSLSCARTHVKSFNLKYLQNFRMWGLLKMHKSLRAKISRSL
jgi:hypothetical protein